MLVSARSGLEAILAEELSAIPGVTAVRIDGPERVALMLAGAPDSLFAARTMLSFRFPLPTERVAEAEDVSDAVARAVSGGAAERIFRAWTVGPPRYRIAWAGGSHRRSATWKTAGAIARRAPALKNDPTKSVWEILVSPRDGAVDVAIVPRALVDPRFSWRLGDVPAASHPTIAAALARVAGVRPDDVVWDPFVGSGTELVERALLGPFRALVGSDADARAIAVAQVNLDSAGVAARLERADALAFAPEGVTLVVTNPPMGRRAVRAAGLSEFLDAFVAHVARSLLPGGRLVWIAPWPTRSRTAGERAQLRLDWARSIDMGGFSGEMQRWVKPG
jgi:23S rRNA G2445 N2-methylase RlmL